jgi:hypothetical protein
LFLFCFVFGLRRPFFLEVAEECKKWPGTRFEDKKEGGEREQSCVSLLLLYSFAIGISASVVGCFGSAA